MSRGLSRARLALWVLALTAGCGPASPPPPVVPAIDAMVGRASRTPTLRLLTLNLAHGRGEAFHQLFTADEAFHRAIDRAGALVARLEPDIVGLQEAEAPSAWSGRFDHVAALARRGGLPHWFHGIHARSDAFGHRVAYGTALASRLPLRRARSVAYARSWRDTKGFVVATVDGPGALGELDVASVHHDFASAAVRAEQAAILIEALRGRGRPLVLLGDFNAEWDDGVAEIAAALRLAPCPLSGPAVTYPADEPDRRFDWILLSKELAVSHCEVLGDRVSDHRALLAVVYAGTAL